MQSAVCSAGLGIDDVLLPFQVFTDGDAQVFSFMFFLKDLSTHGVKAVPWSSSADPQYVALFRVESHAPFLCPVLAGSKVLLDGELVLFTGDVMVHKTIVCEQPYSGTRRYVAWEVIYEYQEEE